MSDFECEYDECETGKTTECYDKQYCMYFN